MSIRQIVLTALTAALSAGASGGARAAGGQCHDLAKAGQHVCAGPSIVDRTPDEWSYGADRGKGAR